jgi:hypothetical protein
MYICDPRTREAQRLALNQAISQFPVLTWLSDFVPVRHTGGVNAYANCPICGGKSKLGVEVNKKIFRCFKCDEGGYGGTTWTGRAGLVKMVGLLTGRSVKDSIKFIFDCAGLPEIRQNFDDIKKWLEERDKRPPSESIALSEAPQDHPSVQMMRRRGMEHLIDVSRVCVSGKYAYRVILPCRFLEETTGFEAKTYMNVDPKALYPEWFKVSNTLYTTREWDHEDDTAILTESILDAETFGRNAVGFYGSNVSDEQVGRLLKLKDHGITRLVWMFDLDAWRKQARFFLRKTSCFFQNYVCRISGKDPNAIGRTAALELLKTAEKIEDEMDLIILSDKWGLEFPL